MVSQWLPQYKRKWPTQLIIIWIWNLARFLNQLLSGASNKITRRTLLLYGNLDHSKSLRLTRIPIAALIDMKIVNTSLKSNITSIRRSTKQQLTTNKQISWGNWIKLDLDLTLSTRSFSWPLVKIKPIKLNSNIGSNFLKIGVKHCLMVIIQWSNRLTKECF